MVILITASGAVVVTTMPGLLDTEARTYFISEELVEATVCPSGCKLAACGEWEGGCCASAT